MTVRTLFICLIGLGWLLAAGCTSAADDPATATQQPTAVATITPPVPLATPIWTPISAAEVQQTQSAHQTPLPPPPSATPTATATPSPTFTPIPGPVWLIQFRGQPCPDSSQNSGDCSKYASTLDFIPAEDYMISSDGSEFITLSEAGIFLADYDYFQLLANSFSPDSLPDTF